MDCFRDFYFEAFTGGELEDGVRGGEECIEELVVGAETHDGDVFDKVWKGFFHVGNGFIEDYGAIGIVD